MSRDSKLKQGQEEGRETYVEQELSPRSVPCVIPVNSDAGMFSMFLQERVNLEHAQALKQSALYCEIEFCSVNKVTYVTFLVISNLHCKLKIEIL